MYAYTRVFVRLGSTNPKSAHAKIGVVGMPNTVSRGGRGEWATARIDRARSKTRSTTVESSNDSSRCFEDRVRSVLGKETVIVAR